MGWYNSSWGYRKKVTLQNGQVAGDLTGFPVLLSFTFGASEKGNVLADGGDIRVTTSDGETEISREIESYDQSTGVFVGWTKVDVLDLTDVILYVYFGNAGASEPAEDAVYGRENVWDSDFAGVWHLSEDPSGGADAMVDSTSGDQDLTSEGTMLTEDQIAAKVNGGIDFDGGDDTLKGPGDGNVDITGALTIEFWTKSLTAATNKVIVSKYGKAGGNRSYLVRTGDSAGKILFAVYKTTPSQVLNTHESTGSVFNGVYRHIVCVFIPSTSLTIYIDGSYDSQNTTSIISNMNDVAIEFRIGAFWNAPVTGFFTGEVDEVRLSSTNRSANWIETSFNTQNDPGSFLIVGDAEIIFEPDVTFEAEAAVTIQLSLLVAPTPTFEAEASISIAIGASPTMSRIMTAIKSALLAYNGTGETLEDIKTFKRGKALKTLIHPAIFIRPIREFFPKIWTGGKYDAHKEVEIRVAAKNLNARTALYKAMEYAEAIRDILAPAHGNLDWNFSGIVWNAELGNIQIGEQTETKGGFVQECILPATYMAKETFPTETDYTTLSEHEPKDLLDLVFTLVNGDSTLSGIKLWSKGRTPPRLRFPACSIIPDEAEYEAYESEHDKRILNLQVLIFTKVLDKETSIDNNLALAELMKDVLQKNVRWGGYARNSEFDIDYEEYQTDNGFLYGTRFNLALDSREKL